MFNISHGKWWIEGCGGERNQIGNNDGVLEERIKAERAKEMSVGETGVSKLTPVRKKNVKVLAHLCAHMLGERICLHVGTHIKYYTQEIHTETGPWTGEMNDVRIWNYNSSDGLSNLSSPPLSRLFSTVYCWVYPQANLSHGCLFACEAKSSKSGTVVYLRAASLSLSLRHTQNHFGWPIVATLCFNLS